MTMAILNQKPFGRIERATGKFKLSSERSVAQSKNLSFDSKRCLDFARHDKNGKTPPRKTDMDVSVLGFGGSEVGYENSSQETVTEILHRALDAGINVIDTAECYRDSEEMIGNTLSNRPR